MSLPTELRSRLAADYAAVRPLPSPVFRALSVAPLGILALLAAPLLFDLRSDADRLGWLMTWGISVAQAALGLAVIAAALRESVPGRAWSASALAGWIIMPVVVLVAATFASFEASQVPLARGWWMVGLVCLGGSAATALPIVALASVLAVRAYPTRPAVAGLLVGVGAGLMADAGWRLFCHFSEPSHVLSAHLGGVGLAAVAGAIVALTLRKPFR